MPGIRFTKTEMQYIALFESVTNVTVRDCIVDEEDERVILVVKEGEAGMAIGRKGRNVRLLEEMSGKKFEIIEYSENPAQFIKNALKSAKVREVRITKRSNGKTIAVAAVDPRYKGIAVGKDGRNAERLRFLMKRYFQMEDVSIV